jgi:hypothetical protein
MTLPRPTGFLAIYGAMALGIVAAVTLCTFGGWL